MAETLAGTQESRWHVTGRGRKQGGRSKRKERMGTVGKMAGWECHPLCSIPAVKVRKVRVQEVGTGGHPFMLTKFASPWFPTATKPGVEKHIFFSSLVDFLGEGAPNTSTLARQLWRSQSKVTSGSGVSPGCYTGECAGSPSPNYRRRVCWTIILIKVPFLGLFRFDYSFVCLKRSLLLRLPGNKQTEPVKFSNITKLCEHQSR